MPTPPRIPPETRQEAVLDAAEAIDDIRASGDQTAVSAAEAAVQAISDVVWSRLLGDARDRVATLIEAADAYLYVTDAGLTKRPAEDIAAKRRGLKRTLAMLEEDGS